MTRATDDAPDPTLTIGGSGVVLRGAVETPPLPGRYEDLTKLAAWQYAGQRATRGLEV